ncbi:NRDE2 protein [Sarcoptes scabiei]|nr:NRDE2 protein [Sarcoptes scabiei]
MVCIRRFCSKMSTSIEIILLSLLVFALLNSNDIDAITVTEVHIMSIKSGRTDYVVAGESVQLSCHYVFTKPFEKVLAVNWRKDGREVYFSTPKKRPISLWLFRGHVDYNSKDLLNTVTLFDIDMRFAGQYSCRVITEYNESENTAQMIVIVDSCKDSNWKTKTDMVNCAEEISFHCVGMYPKPSPACSIHNDLTDHYFAGETFDMIERLPNGTYEIAIQRRYLAKNFLEYPGQLSFHCHLLVLMTSWRMGIKYKLFGDAGCVDPPPKINNGTSILSGDKTCWRTPKENSRVNYSCHDGFRLMGPSVLICRNGSWIPDPIHLMSQPVFDLSTFNQLRLPMPYCQISQSFLDKSKYSSAKSLIIIDRQQSWILLINILFSSILYLFSESIIDP